MLHRPVRRALVAAHGLSDEGDVAVVPSVVVHQRRPVRHTSNLLKRITFKMFLLFLYMGKLLIMQKLVQWGQSRPISSLLAGPLECSIEKFVPKNDDWEKLPIDLHFGKL